MDFDAYLTTATEAQSKLISAKKKIKKLNAPYPPQQQQQQQKIKGAEGKLHIICQ